MGGAILDFVILYVLLVSLAVMFGPAQGRDPQVLVAAFFAALGLSYFWVAWRKGKS